MCYSVESSLKTTLVSLSAIVYLLTSNIPHYQWLGVTLIGWCAMQFDELLLWLTNPLKECTKWNKIITQDRRCLRNPSSVQFSNSTGSALPGGGGAAGRRNKKLFLI